MSKNKNKTAQTTKTPSRKPNTLEVIVKYNRDGTMKAAVHNLNNKKMEKFDDVKMIVLSQLYRILASFEVK